MKVSENKPHSVHLRLTDTQYNFCLENAEIMGVGVSDFIRMALNTMAVTSIRFSEKLAASKQLGDLAHEDNKSDIEHRV